MKNKRAVVVSTNYSDKYLFYLPIVWYAWRKIGWDLICMMPANFSNNKKWDFVINKIFERPNDTSILIVPFECSKENEILYTQCSRLYAGNIAIPEYDTLMLSDVDMLPLSNYWHPEPDKITVYGKDLSDQHVPVCYVSASPAKWREIMDLTGNVTMDMDCDLDYYMSISEDKWTTDQLILTTELAAFQDEMVWIDRGKSPHSDYPIGRIDRSAWVASHKETQRIDCHLPRPGFSDQNWPLILNEIKENLNPTEEDLQWMNQYRNDYLKLL